MSASDDARDPFQRTSAQFATTQWADIRAAQDDPEAFGSLVRRYWAPIYAFARRSGRQPADAADITQQFIIDVIDRRDLLSRADPDRGRFRSLLKTALVNFMRDLDRGAATAKASTTVGAVQLGDLAAAEPRDDLDPATAFDRRWAADILQRAIDVTAHACRDDGLEAHWRVFSERVLAPAMHGADPTPLESLASDLGAPDTQQVVNMVRTVKRRFDRALRGVVAETADEVEDELDRIRALLRFSRDAGNETAESS